MAVCEGTPASLKSPCGELSSLGRGHYRLRDAIFGLELLDMAREVAAFNLPVRVGQLFGISM